MTSAYPAQFDELVGRAQQLARELGAIPSQNRLKAALHVRSERARAVLQALRQAGFEPSEPAADRPASPSLHLVPDGARRTAAEIEPVAPVEFSGAPPTMVPDAERREPVPADLPVTVPKRASEAAEPVPAPRLVRPWPVVLLAAPAFVAIWSGWVGLGALTGFGLVHPLPGIADGFTLNSAITLPIGVETYAAYALRVWLAAGHGSDHRARQFAKWSAIGALVLGAGGQVAYHLMIAARMTTAPWWITTGVSCLPVVVLGLGAALAHLQHPRHGRTEVGR